MTQTPIYTIEGEPHTLTAGGQWVQNVLVSPGEFGFARTTYIVPLPFVGEGRIQHIKRVRESLCVGVKEAKDLSDLVWPRNEDGANVSGGAVTRTIEKLPSQLERNLTDRVNTLLIRADAMRDALIMLSELFDTGMGASQGDASFAAFIETAARKSDEAYWALYDAQHALAQGRLFDDGMPF